MINTYDMRMKNIKSKKTKNSVLFKSQHCDEFKQAQEASKTMLPSNIELLKRVPNFGVKKTATAEYVPFDINVYTQDDNSDGYAHMLSYLGTYCYMLHHEQGLGCQHDNKEILKFLTECFDAIDELGVINTLSLLNPAHDDVEVIKLHQDRNKHFIIKCKLDEKFAGQWLLLARCVGTCQALRKSKNRYVGVVNNIELAENEDLGAIFTVFEVIEHTIKANGQELLEPEIEVSAWWTNLPEDPETIINLYFNHRASEHFYRFRKLFQAKGKTKK